MSAVATTSEQMSRALSTIDHTIRELSAAINGIATNARDGAAVAGSAAQAAVQTGGIMTDLGRSAEEIGKVTGVIQVIAQQTNLLALNAAIEAAGAGEAGARFAVVADQVRKLAESSTQATREIADLVKVIQNETQDAVVAMEQETQAVEAGSASALRTGEVFNEISTIAQRSAELAQTIAQSAATQTASTDQVGRSIKDFTGGAMATQKATDSARLTVEDMAKLADSLTASVAQFKLA